MRISDITLIGWLHTITILVALIAGAINLVSDKGTAQHKLVGQTYFWSMIASNLSAFAIYRFDIARYEPFTAGPHVFGVFHWLAVSSLILVILGRYAASRQERAVWAYLHPVAMILSYYLIIGGLINEAFVRLDVPRAIAIKSAGGVTLRVDAPIIQMTRGWAVAA